MPQAKRTAETIKIKGRKYIVVHTSVARIDHKNVALQLVKRAGKVQWFTLENGELTRRKDFWSALEAYSTRQDTLGLNPTDSLPHDELLSLISAEVGPVTAAFVDEEIREEDKTATVELKHGDTDFRQRKYPEEYTAATVKVTHA